MSAKHTPGPWEFYSGICGLVVQRGNSGGNLIEDKNKERAEADARLIAAAPDMLEALIQYADDLRYPPQGDSIQRRLERVEKLLARITGDAA